MGYNVSNVFVRGVPVPKVLEVLELRETSPQDDVPDAAISGTELSSSFYLIFYNHRVPSLKSLKALSQLGKVIYLDVAETVGASIATAWTSGNESWQISHDSSRGRDDLLMWGNLPEGTLAVADGYRENAKQDSNIDYVFNVPVVIVQQLTGFRYDKDRDGLMFRVLESTVAIPWWKFW